MEATVKQDFIFNEETVEHLKMLSEDSHEPMNDIVQKLIEQKYQEYRKLKVKKRVEAFEKIVGSATGLLGDFSIQSVKANMNV